MNQIYTAGYSGKTSEQLRHAATTLNAMVLDIRTSPRSQMPEWNGDALRAKLPYYLHVPALGNPGYGGRGEMGIKDYEVGRKRVRFFSSANWGGTAKPVILLCGCREYEGCHRALVAERLREDGFTVEELAWPEVPAAPGCMKAISLWQPWASLIAIGAKQIETRGWATTYRGPLAIHAAKRWTQEEIFFLAETRFAHDALCAAGYEWGTLPRQGTTLPRGVIVAVCDLIGCLPTTGAKSEHGTGPKYADWVHEISTQERTFGDYSLGRFGWVLENVRVLPEPVPYKGARQLFDVELTPEQMEVRIMMERSALISECGQYRYNLRRVWLPQKPIVAFVGLNPSTADANCDDPTLRRVVDFAQRWGYGGLVLLNLFAFRSTDPHGLRLLPDPNGPLNDAMLQSEVSSARLVVAAWGEPKWPFVRTRAKDVCHLLRGHDLHAIQVTEQGQPRHPLYLRAELKPQIWRRGEAQ